MISSKDCSICLSTPGSRPESRHHPNSATASCVSSFRSRSSFLFLGGRFEQFCSIRLLRARFLISYPWFRNRKSCPGRCEAQFGQPPALSPVSPEALQSIQRPMNLQFRHSIRVSLIILGREIAVKMFSHLFGATPVNANISKNGEDATTEFPEAISTLRRCDEARFVQFLDRFSWRIRNDARLLW